MTAQVFILSVLSPRNNGKALVRPPRDIRRRRPGRRTGGRISDDQPLRATTNTGDRAARW